MQTEVLDQHAKVSRVDRVSKTDLPPLFVDTSLSVEFLNVIRIEAESAESQNVLQERPGVAATTKGMSLNTACY